MPPLPPMPVDGRLRRVLSVSVGSVAAESGAESGKLEPLPFAASQSAALAKALASLGYHGKPALTSDSAEDIGRSVGAAISGADRDDVLVVHILGHGELGETGSVYVVGADGKTHPLTDIEHWLKMVEDFPGRPCTLFLLDLCHSGVAARLPWQLANADGPGQAWVIAASQPDRQAFDGRFTKAVATVLGRLRRGELDIDQSVQCVPIGTVAREIRREVDALGAASGGFRQQVTCSVTDISAQVDVPFFPNPRYRENSRNEVRGQISTALAPFLDDLDEIFDAQHFISRAAGHGPIADHSGVGCFSGRKAELTALTAWMNRDEDGPIRLVTGSAGVGKSALIGVLVCAAHPALRVPTRMLWEQVERVPARVPHMAAAHARQRTLAQVTQSLASQLGFDECATPGELVAKVAQSPTRPLLVVDALDEALEPSALMHELLIPLATKQSADGEFPCRLLIGVRCEPEYSRLREIAEARSGLVDLDRVPDDRLREDLEEYVGKLLRSQPPYGERTYAGARAMFAASVADTLVSRRAGHRWGEFLVAALYTHHLLTAPEPIADLVQAERLGLQVPSELPEVLEVDLRSRRNISFLRAVLAVLAHALGEGMPASLIRAAAPMFAGGQSPSATQTVAALDAARFYLRHTVDTDGTTIYRLFHQGLADYLRQHPVSSSAPAPDEVAGEIARRLLDALPTAGTGAGAGRQWNLAEPYLLRHALQHAEAASMQAELASDGEFLVHADPTLAVPLLISRDTGAPATRTLSAFIDKLAGLIPEDRRFALALAAVRHGDAQTAQRLANPPGLPPLTWQPVWASGREVATPSSDLDDIIRRGRSTGSVTLAELHQAFVRKGLTPGEARSVLRELSEDGVRLTDGATAPVGSEPDPVKTAIAADLPNGHVVVAIRRSGAIESRDLDTGRGVTRWPAIREITTVGELRIGGQVALVASAPEKSWICLDPAAGTSFVDASPYPDVQGKRFGDAGAVGIDLPAFPAARSIVAGGVVEILGLSDGSWILEDHVTRQPLGRLSAPSSRWTWLCAHTPTIGGRPLLATGSAEGALVFWDLTDQRLSAVVRLDGPVEQIIPAGRDRLVLVVGGTLLALKHVQVSVPSAEKAQDLVRNDVSTADVSPAAR